MASPVFLDANAIIYSLDATSDYNGQAIAVIQRLLADGSELCTSHHVIEEVVYVAVKATGRRTPPTAVVAEIGRIPGLLLIEPAANLKFAERYAMLCEENGLGVNDALLLQLMIDSGLTRLFSYDKRFINAAKKLGIEPIEFMQRSLDDV